MENQQYLCARAIQKTEEDSKKLKTNKEPLPFVCVSRISKWYCGMIALPRMISARGHDCVVASVTMVSMYWRQAKQSLPWNLPLDFDHEEWSNFYEKVEHT